MNRDWNLPTGACKVRNRVHGFFIALLSQTSKSFMSVKKWTSTIFVFGEQKTLMKVTICQGTPKNDSSKGVIRQWSHEYVLRWLPDCGCRELSLRIVWIISTNVAYHSWKHNFPAGGRIYKVLQSGKTAVRYVISWFLDCKRRSHCLATSLTKTYASHLLYKKIWKR